jgi:hypothetical protein
VEQFLNWAAAIAALIAAALWFWASRVRVAPAEEKPDEWNDAAVLYIDKRGRASDAIETAAVQSWWNAWAATAAGIAAASQAILLALKALHLL